MKPTLCHDQIIFALNVRNFRKGQVVVAHVGSREVIKRISKIEGGRVFLEGDNADQSTDSRSYGSVIDTNIVGTVIWPKVTRSN